MYETLDKNSVSCQPSWGSAFSGPFDLNPDTPGCEQVWILEINAFYICESRYVWRWGEYWLHAKKER